MNGQLWKERPAWLKPLLRALSPRHKRDHLALFIASIGAIFLVNLLFEQFFFGGPRTSHEEQALRALIVGGPFVVVYQFGLLAQYRLQKRLAQQSKTDGLTQLNNRRTFLTEASARHRSAARPGVLFLLDADHFKRINDTYGHHVGDSCLQSIAYVLQRNLRGSDVIGRIGGEEFAAYLPETTMQQACAIAARLTKPIAFRGDDENPHLTVTLSIGAVRAGTDQSLDRLLRNADHALYAAKSAGRARLEIFDGLMPDRRRSRPLELIEELDADEMAEMGIKPAAFARA